MCDMKAEVKLYWVAVGTKEGRGVKKSRVGGVGGICSHMVYTCMDTYIIYNVQLKLSKTTVLLIGYEKNITISNMTFSSLGELVFPSFLHLINQHKIGSCTRCWKNRNQNSMPFLP